MLFIDLYLNGCIECSFVPVDEFQGAMIGEGGALDQVNVFQGSRWVKNMKIVGKNVNKKKLKK